MCYLAMHTGSNIMLFFLKSTLGLWLMFLFFNLVTVVTEQHCENINLYLRNFSPNFLGLFVVKKMMCHVVHHSSPCSFWPTGIYIAPSIHVYSWQLLSHLDLHHSPNITVTLTISFKNRHILFYWNKEQEEANNRMQIFTFKVSFDPNRITPRHQSWLQLLLLHSQTMLSVYT